MSYELTKTYEVQVAYDDRVDADGIKAAIESGYRKGVVRHCDVRLVRSGPEPARNRTKIDIATATEPEYESLAWDAAVAGVVRLLEDAERCKLQFAIERCGVGAVQAAIARGRVRLGWVEEYVDGKKVVDAAFVYLAWDDVIGEVS